MHKFWRRSLKFGSHQRRTSLDVMNRVRFFNEMAQYLRNKGKFLDFDSLWKISAVNPSRQDLRPFGSKHPTRPPPSDGGVHRSLALIVASLYQRVTAQQLIAMGICGSKTEAVQAPAPTTVSLSRSRISASRVEATQETSLLDGIFASCRFPQNSRVVLVARRKHRNIPVLERRRLMISRAPPVERLSTKSTSSGRG